MSLPSNINQSSEIISNILRPDLNFDIVKREVCIGGKTSRFFFVDGFMKDAVVEKMLEFLLKIKPEEITAEIVTAEDFARKFITYTEVDMIDDPETIVTMVLSGAMCLLIDGYDKAFLIDTRTYPSRGVEEPDSDKVLRGSHDGFTETIIFNTALLRRRIKDPKLRIEIFDVGKKSRTNVTMCYLEGTADNKLVEKIKAKINSITIDSLTMGQESLTEVFIKNKWYNPFPKVRYTERPDAAASSVYEGKVIIFVDNSPAALILPTSIFDFVQEADDYYFPPFTGSYFRITRLIIFLLTLILTPTWLLLIKNPSYIPSWLEFIKVKSPVSIPIIWQLLLIEFTIDGLKLASLNTPDPLNNSLSIIGGLILSDFAVDAGWLVPEVILYMAFVAIANFTQPSYELGYAFKFMRVILLITTSLFNLWGYIGGILLVIILVCTNKTVEGKGYLEPLIPFNAKEFGKLFIRHSLTKVQK